MEEKINIAEILKDKPEGTKLWTDMFGSVTLYVVTDVCDAFQVKHHNKEPWFDKDGKLCKEGVLCIYPSKSMRDWRKFAWKRGDALSCGVDNLCIFEKWANKEYTEFYAKFVTPNYSGNTFKTEKWSKETNEAVIKQYISNIEEFKGGKLNLTTLEIEKPQPEFKDGDIVFEKSKHSLDDYIAIYRTAAERHVYDYCSLNLNTNKLDCTRMFGCSFGSYSFRLATESEKQQLFEALAKKNKAWDSEKKQIVDLKTKYEFKPMDLCLMKYIGKYNNRGWELCQYAYTEHRVSSSGEQRDFYHSVGGEIYAECIPYNEDTKHLLGTKTEWKGGEG